MGRVCVCVAGGDNEEELEGIYLEVVTKDILNMTLIS